MSSLHLLLDLSLLLLLVNGFQVVTLLLYLSSPLRANCPAHVHVKFTASLLYMLVLLSVICFRAGPGLTCVCHNGKNTLIKYARFKVSCNLIYFWPFYNICSQASWKICWNLPLACLYGRQLLSKVNLFVYDFDICVVYVYGSWATHMYIYFLFYDLCCVVDICNQHHHQWHDNPSQTLASSRFLFQPTLSSAARYQLLIRRSSLPSLLTLSDDLSLGLPLGLFPTICPLRIFVWSCIYCTCPAHWRRWSLRCVDRFGAL